MQSPSQVSRRGFIQAVAGATILSRTGAAADSAQILRYANVQNVSDSSATIAWSTSANIPSLVIVTDAAGNSKTAVATVASFPAAQTGMDSDFFLYQASFSGLNPAATYSYQVVAGGVALAFPGALPTQFTTAGNGPFQFLHFADSGEGNQEQTDLSKQMLAEPVALVLANGDLAYDLATYQSVEDNYFGVYRAQMTQVPFFATLGNHEYLTNSALPSLAGRVAPPCGVAAADRGRYYSFDWGNVHFVALDSNDPLTNSIAGTCGMLNWLASDLQATRKFWRVVFFHHPPYATGKHQDEPPAGMVRQAIVPILEQYGVQLVLNGHEHTYERTYALLGGQVVDADSGGIVYVTSGGGGADATSYDPSSLIVQNAGVNHYVRAAVSGAAMDLHTIALGGSEIDTFRLAPLPQAQTAVNPASWSTSLASGGLLAITGRNLCPYEVTPPLNGALTEASGSYISLDGVRLPMVYASAGQINAQIPFSFVGVDKLVVTTANGSTQIPISVAAAAPAIFLNPDGSANALAMHADGSMVTAGAPAAAGETITLWLTGLGAVAGSVTPGTMPAAPVPVRARVQVVFGGVAVDALRAVLRADLIGVYEVAAVVPQGQGRRVVNVQVTADWISGDMALLPVK